MFHRKKRPSPWVMIVLAIVALILLSFAWMKFDGYSKKQLDRDMIRRSESVAILNAIHSYRDDNEGVLPNIIDNEFDSVQIIGESEGDCSMSCNGMSAVAECVDLRPMLVDTGYLLEMPSDPKVGDSSNSRYYVNKMEDGMIKVGACKPEDAKKIEVRRK